MGLGELDVIGFDFIKREVHLCEVTTHLDGLQIGKGAKSTIGKLIAKHRRQQEYAAKHLHLPGYTPRFMFWSPIVRAGLVKELESSGFELFINERYSEAMAALRKKARSSTADANNPAFRVLQILEHLRRQPVRLGP